MRRGRPRKTEPNEVLNAVMEIFWEKGYDGTSMADLVNATGMAKPGLYATFGDKEKLYSLALEKYFTELGNPIIQEFIESDQPVEETVRNFLMKVTEGMFDESRPNGCFLVNCLVEIESDIPNLEKMARKYNEIRRKAFID